MKIQTYFEKLNTKSQAIFVASMLDPELHTKVHGLATSLFKLSTCLSNKHDSKMISLVCAQLESSSLALSYGLYRPALTALRMSFEFGMGSIYFSSNHLAYKEWQNGSKDADLKWSMLNSPESGVLSKRFALAFFPALVESVESFQDRARSTYRCLSEYVHGNSDTWKKSGMSLALNPELVALYAAQLEEIEEILKFAFCCRYLNEIGKECVEDVYAVIGDRFTHVEPIRVAFGGPKDIV